MNEVDKSNKECPICLSQLGDNRFKYNNFDRSHIRIFDHIEIKYCSSCGFGFSYPDLDDSTIDNFYKHDYRNEGEFLRKIEYHLDHRSIAQIFLALQFCEWNKGDIFLDVGPGGGTSFSSALSILDEPVLAAIELAEDAIQDFQNIYSVTGGSSISDVVTKLKSKPKIVLSSHSLEHFTFKGALKFINDVNEFLDPNGVFICEVPSEDFKKNMVVKGEHAPHFLFFSKASLRKLFESNGFEVKFIDTCSLTFDFIDELNNSEEEIITHAALEKGAKSFIKNIVKSILLKFNRRGRVILDNHNFKYGGDRICLRIVAVKKN